MKSDRRRFYAALSLGVVAAFFVLREHWGHVLGVLPYIVLLLCPVLHLFHGHGGHASHKGEADEKATP